MQKTKRKPQNVNGEVKPYQIKQFLNIIKKYNLEE